MFFIKCVWFFQSLYNALFLKTKNEQIIIIAKQKMIGSIFKVSSKLSKMVFQSRPITSVSSRTQVVFELKLVGNKNILLLQQKPKTCAA